MNLFANAEEARANTSAFYRWWCGWWYNHDRDQASNATLRCDRCGGIIPPRYP